MRRFLIALTPAALLMMVGCMSATDRGLNIMSITATATVEPTAVTSVCETQKTPQPTRAPGDPVPTTAFRFENPPLPPQTGRSDLVDTQFYSPVLEQSMPILVYLPPGYADSTRRYPVLYMLSGFSGDSHEWVNWGLCDQLEVMIRGGYIQPLIVVLPEGGHSWWFNHAKVPDSDGKAWGDYVWMDVVHFVDGNYRTLPRRQSRAIGGLSAGGQAAFTFALTHPEVFSIAGAHSPSIRHADGSLPFFGDQAYFDQYDPTWLVRYRDSWKQLKLWMDVGSDDEQWGQSIHEFHDLLVFLKIPHAFEDSWRGVHDNPYWAAHTPDYLNWYAAQLASEDKP